MDVSIYVHTLIFQGSTSSQPWVHMPNLVFVFTAVGEIENKENIFLCHEKCLHTFEPHLVRTYYLKIQESPISGLM